MFDVFAQILGSAGVGSLIGGFFSHLGRKEERKTKESEYKYKLEAMKLGGDIAVQTADAEAFKETQKTLSKFGDGIKSAVRPLITGVLLWQTYLILTSLETLTGGIVSLPVDQSLELYETIVSNIISLTATAVNWWFGARGSSKK